MNPNDWGPKDWADVIAGAQVILGLVRALVWPILILVLFVMFKDQVKELIRNLESYKGPLGEFRFTTGSFTPMDRGPRPPDTGSPGVPRPPDIGPPPKPSNVSLLYFVPLPIVRGTIVAGAAFFANIGQVIESARIFHYVRIVDTPAPNEQERLEEEYFKAFIGQVPDVGPLFAIPASSQVLSMNYGPILTTDMVNGFEAGKKTIYYMGALRYQLGQQTFQLEYSRYLTNTGLFVAKRHNVVFPIG